MQNPLLKNQQIYVYDKDTNEEIPITMLNIAKYYRNVYCLCPFSSISIEDITAPFINSDKFDTHMNSMVLYQANISIIRNIIHFGNLVECSLERIKNANHFNYKLDDKILVLPIFNINFLALQTYIDSINGLSTLNKIYDMIILNKYFGDDNQKINIKFRINSMITILEEAKYWQLPYNCMMNLTKLFEQRNFNFSSIRINTDKDMHNLLQRLDKSAIKENYLNQIFNTKNYVDPSIIINRKGYKLYSKVWSCEYTKEDINNLFSNLDNYQKYTLFNNLCVSKQYCHLVVNNFHILNIMKSFINKNIYEYHYMFGYAWIRFYFEETINRFNVKTTDMYIFDINTASELPVFYFDYKKPHNNPYMPLIISNNSIRPESNIGGVVSTYVKDIDRRICNLAEFKERMNVFISGNKNIDFLYGIDFEKLKIGITGSIMTACAQYQHPLIHLFINEQTNGDFNSIYKRYFNEYYYDSDIDMMVKTTNIFEFLDLSKEFYNKLTDNINICMNLNKTDIFTKYTIIKTSFLFVTKEFLEKYICNESITYDFIIKNLNNPAIITKFIPYAQKMHNIECDKILSELDEKEQNELILKYPDMFTFDSTTVAIKFYDTKTKTTQNNQKMESEMSQDEIELILESSNMVEDKIETDIKIVDGLSYTTSFKVKISSPYLDHSFELFSIKKDDFMTSVANFHMPCVRAYYDGNVYMTPSFISAHMTFMNIDYKYFAGVRDPIEIINKYRMRGFGVWLNKNEISTYIKYCYEVPFWNNIFQINPNNKNTYKNCLGYLSLIHALFKPRQNNKDLINPNAPPIPIDNPYNSYLNTTNLQMENYYSKRYQCSERKYITSTINDETGYINTLLSHIVNFVPSTYSMFNDNK
jgi:hypothetical protein